MHSELGYSAYSLLSGLINGAATLKTLFNIEEDQLKKFLNFDVCVVLWCTDGSINSQECKRFDIGAVTIKKSMIEYHNLINHQAYLILTQQSIGGNEYGESGHLYIFTSLKHLMMLFQYKFSGLHYTPYQRHW